MDHVVTPRGVCGRDKGGMNMIRRDKVWSGLWWDISLSQARCTSTHTEHMHGCRRCPFFPPHLPFFNQLHWAPIISDFFASVTSKNVILTSVYFFLFFFAVEFDDCAGNEDVQFEVSDPRFHVDADLNLVPHRDVQSTSPVLFIHGTSAHADDVADVGVGGRPVESAYTLRVCVGHFMGSCASVTVFRSKQKR